MVSIVGLFRLQVNPKPYSGHWGLGFKSRRVYRVRFSFLSASFPAARAVAFSEILMEKARVFGLRV